ncbi:MATE family efflux transporter [Azotosporobacter soli]|uniref:MATE family efflux transporter n=1 Tax=Azotosporobacter soli TaxID=3055040 RepID=UPI0031FEFBD2
MKEVKISKETSVVKTFLQYTIPCIITMFLTSFIVIVDGFFIGWKVGEHGLAAVNFTLPILYLLLAVTLLLGVGGVTLATQSRGARQTERANYFFTLSLTAVALVNVVLVSCLAAFLDEVVLALGASGITKQYALEFLGVLQYFYLFIMLNMAFSMFIRAEGKPQLALLFGVAGNILNIVLDYWFVVGLDWGMRGAAMASGLAVLLPFIVGLAYFVRRKSAYCFCKCQVKWVDLKNIALNGTAEFIAQISVSLTTFLYNIVLLERLGVNGVAALTVIGYVLFLHSMVITGIAIGVHPLISYHFGARNREKINAFLAMAVKAVILVGGVLGSLSFVAAEAIIGLFANGNEELIQIGQLGLRWFSTAFILTGYNIIATVFFTSIGQAKTAAAISVLRSLALVALFILLLPRLLGELGIWITMPLTEAITLVIAYRLLQRCRERAYGLFASEQQVGKAGGQELI